MTQRVIRVVSVRFMLVTAVCFFAIGVVQTVTMTSFGLITFERQAVTEDDPGWDCLRQGNVTCKVDGVLVTSLEGLPADPFARCVFLLDIGRRVDPDGLTYVDSVCDPIRTQLG